MHGPLVFILNSWRFNNSRLSTYRSAAFLQPGRWSGLNGKKKSDGPRLTFLE
jgi:hypothetical protein